MMKSDGYGLLTIYKNYVVPDSTREIIVPSNKLRSQVLAAAGRRIFWPTVLPPPTLSDVPTHYA